MARRSVMRPIDQTILDRAEIALCWSLSSDCFILLSRLQIVEAVGEWIQLVSSL